MGWRDNIRAIRRPGRIRRGVVALVLAIMISICVALVLSSPQSEVLVALGIFLISVSGFSFIAWITFDAAIEWRFVDFPWICTSS